MPYMALHKKLPVPEAIILKFSLATRMFSAAVGQRLVQRSVVHSDLQQCPEETIPEGDVGGVNGSSSIIIGVGCTAQTIRLEGMHQS